MKDIYGWKDKGEFHLRKLFQVIPGGNGKSNLRTDIFKLTPPPKKKNKGKRSSITFFSFIIIALKIEELYIYLDWKWWSGWLEFWEVTHCLLFIFQPMYWHNPRTRLHSQSHPAFTNGYSIYWSITSRTRVFEFSTDRKTITWLWRWLPHRLPKRQSPTTVLQQWHPVTRWSFSIEVCYSQVQTIFLYISIFLNRFK